MSGCSSKYRYIFMRCCLSGSLHSKEVMTSFSLSFQKSNFCSGVRALKAGRLYSSSKFSQASRSIERMDCKFSCAHSFKCLLQLYTSSFSFWQLQISNADIIVMKNAFFMSVFLNS